MTPSASPTLEIPIPECGSRSLIDLLLEEDEQVAFQDTVAIETVDVFDTDGVAAWGYSVSLPKPSAKSVSSHTRTKKGSKSFPIDIDPTNIRVRCVNEDYNGEHHKSSWKANVEPGTYRYINNNGIYRSTKFANTGNDWVTVKRTRQAEAMALTVTPEVRNAQRTLKKDLNQLFRSKITDQNEPSNPENSSSESEINPPIKAHSATTAYDSTDGQYNTRDRLKLIKSTSDLFVEKFSTRMDALHKSDMELQITPVPRTPATPSKPGTNSSKRHEQHQAFDKAQSDTDDISKDVFTVKSVPKISAEQPLGPLEKLTPQQRNMDRGSGSECSSLNNSRCEQESPVLPSSFMNAMNAFAQLQYKQFRGKDSKAKSGSSSYRSRHKNSMGSVSSSSNMSDTDSLNSVRNAITMTNSSIERMRMRPYGRESAPVDYAVKDYGKFLKNSKYRLSTSKNLSTKPPHGNAQRKGIVGYRPNISHTQVTGPDVMTTTSSTRLAPTIQPVAMQPSAEDIKSTVSDSTDSYLSGASMTVHRGSGSLRDAKAGSLALPEISGKRLPVTMSQQRMM